MKSRIARRIKAEGLDKRSIIVVSSGTLEVLGIRKANDIDIVVSKDLYDSLTADGWQEFHFKNYSVLRKDEFEAFPSWDNKGLQQLLKEAFIDDGVNFVNLEVVYRWKKETGREKDLKDIKLIEAYLKKDL